MSNRGKERPGQYAFVVGGEFAKNVGSILDLPDGREIVEIAESRKRLWKPKGINSLGLYQDLRGEGQQKVFRMDSWQTVPMSVATNKLSSIVVVIPTISYNELIVEPFLEEKIYMLANNSPALVFEEKGGDIVDPADKLSSLRHVNLVRRSELVSLSDKFNLLEARTAKKAKRTPVDATDGVNHPKARAEMVRRWRLMKKYYAEIGYEVINQADSPIIERMRHSTFIPKDYELLSQGWGVRIKSRYCDCTYDVDFKGGFHEVRPCGNEDHKPPRR